MVVAVVTHVLVVDQREMIVVVVVVVAVVVVGGGVVVVVVVASLSAQPCATGACPDAWACCFEIDDCHFQKRGICLSAFCHFFFAGGNRQTHASAPPNSRGDAGIPVRRPTASSDAASKFGSPG